VLLLKLILNKEGVFSISDNGIGIERKMFKKIFMQFFQIDDNTLAAELVWQLAKK